jgi:acetylornithine deacetylase/succinyl-diaminopimelate desuccinylase-like protein
MAGISVTLEGDNIQLSFQKGEQSTAVVMDPHAARSLVRAVSQLLAAIGESTGEGEGEEMPEELVDVTSQTIDVGMDEHGMAVVALQAGMMPPFLLRLKDDEARHIAQSLLEILNSPRDARISHGDH